METYSEAHVIEAFLLGIVVAATLATVYFKRFSNGQRR